MSHAWVQIREQPWYRRSAFVDGLKAAGYEVRLNGPERARPGDVLCIWNRYSHWHDTATRFERDGGTVLCAENGYLGAGGTSPKFDVHPGGPKPGDYYAIARGWHNGRGTWPEGDGSRWAALGVTLKPWRTAGEHILVAPNRSFGVGEQLMHPDWGERTAARLRKMTGRPVRIRAHPGNDRPKRPLEADLKGAWATVIWSSGAGVHALVAGIPVFCAAPYWICKSATLDDLGLVESFDTSQPWDRMAADACRVTALERMAWAQFTVAEISSGVPFRHLQQ